MASREGAARMGFTVEDYQDLVRLLAERPQWQVELRRLLLSDDFLALPAIVRDLAKAQERTERRLEELAAAQARTEQRLEELAAAQARTEQRLEALALRVEELAEAQKRTEQRLEELAEAQKRTEQEVRALTDRVGAIDGRTLELIYREKAPAYFGGLLRRLRVVSPHVLEDTLEAHLSQEECVDVLRLDLLLTGRPRGAPADLAEAEVWLAVEVSAAVDLEDVAHARSRAGYLRKAGYRAIPVVAGRRVLLDAEAQARALSMVVLEDGRASMWEEALKVWAQPAL